MFSPSITRLSTAPLRKYALKDASFLGVGSTRRGRAGAVQDSKKLFLHLLKEFFISPWFPKTSQAK